MPKPLENDYCVQNPWMMWWCPDLLPTWLESAYMQLSPNWFNTKFDHFLDVNSTHSHRILWNQLGIHLKTSSGTKNFKSTACIHKHWSVSHIEQWFKKLLLHDMQVDSWGCHCMQNTLEFWIYKPEAGCSASMFHMHKLAVNVKAHPRKPQQQKAPHFR